MANLIVTAAVLEESTAKLTSIKTEFDHVDDHSHADDSIWGQSALTSAMGKFSGDWKIHRGKISEAVGGLQKKLEEMTAAFTDTEKQLSESLETSTETA
ncbi:hypothetical protein [Lacisediminihabitans sp.]|uniref:hypothetical protein n=1 Tax=Lacisediminihabitans sp. TaxID=2787631 RepID=UPI00374CA447